MGAAGRQANGIYFIGAGIYYRNHGAFGAGYKTYPDPTCHLGLRLPITFREIFIQKPIKALEHYFIYEDKFYQVQEYLYLPEIIL